MSDQDTTAQLPAGEPPRDPPRSGGPRRLLRSRSDRMIAGVAGGLASYFNVDPVIVRIAFAISIFFGGLGVIAYAALALFVPSEPTEGGEVGPPPAERSRALAIGAGVALVVVALSWGVFDGPGWWGHGFFWSPFVFVALLVGAAILIARRARGRSRSGGVLGTVLIAFAAFIGLSIVAVGAAWAAATGHGVLVAIIVIAVGAMLALAAFNGGARWLIAPALAVAIPLGVVSAADVSFGDGIGERTYRPLSAASVPERYELGIGRLQIDLRQLDWQDDTVVDLNVDVGIGQGVVAVPSNVCVTTDLDARAGDLRIAGDDSDGVDVHSQANAGSTATPRLDLTGEVDLGELVVINDDDADLDARDHFRFGESENRDAMAAALTAACTEPQPPVDNGGSVDGNAGQAGNGADSHRKGGDRGARPE
jgi:phage shock protein PspC (stress-responsive transcriptional regulator)